MNPCYPTVRVSGRKVVAFIVVWMLLQAACAPRAPRYHQPLQPESARPTEGFSLPLKNMSVLSWYGPRGKKFHTGIDLRGRRGGGDHVLAARGGRVTMATQLRGYGKIIVIKHSDGFTTRYAHLKRFLVKKDQKVKALQPIGIVGRTGRASTEHLHFEILTPKQRFLDPANYLPGLKKRPT